MVSLNELDRKLQAEFGKICSFRSAVAFIRGPFTEAIQEACALLPVNDELLGFFSQVLFAAVQSAMESVDAFLLESGRVEVIAAWHAIYLADAAVKPYHGSFLYLFEEKFVGRMAAEFGELAEEEMIPAPEQAKNEQEMAKVNQVVDAVNLIRSCPPSELFSTTLLKRLEKGEIKSWAARQLS